MDRLGPRSAAGAQRQRVILRKRALSLQTRGDGDVQELRQLAQLLPGPSVVHPLTRVDDRALRVAENLGHGDDRCRIRSGTGGEGRLVVQRLPQLLPEQVERELDQHRTGPAVAHLGEGPAHGLRNRSGHRDLLGPLGDVAIVEGGVEIRSQVGDPSRIAHWQHQDGNRVPVGLSHAPERVLRAGAVLHREHADPLARVHATEGVRHVETGSLLANDDGPDVGLGRRLDDRAHGIRDDELDALTLQNLCDCVDDPHCILPSCAHPFARRTLYAAGSSYPRGRVTIFANRGSKPYLQAVGYLRYVGPRCGHPRVTADRSADAGSSLLGPRRALMNHSG